MGDSQNAAKLAVMQAGYRPHWVTQLNNAVPLAAGDGTTLNLVADGFGALQAHILAALRLNGTYRTLKITVTVANLTAIYTVTIGGLACTYNAGTAGAVDAASIINGLAAAITSAAGTIVNAAASDPGATGANTLITVTGKDSTDWSVTFSSGAGTLVVEADYATATANVYVNPGTSRGGRGIWQKLAGYTGIALDVGGYAKMVPVAGWERIQVALSSLVGATGDGGTVTYRAPIVSVGPCDVS